MFYAIPKKRTTKAIVSHKEGARNSVVEVKMGISTTNPNKRENSQ